MTDAQHAAAKALLERMAANDPGLKSWLDLLHQAIARLDGPAGVVVRMMIADVPTREIARRMGVSVRRVYRYRRDGLAKARSMVRAFRARGRWPDEPAPVPFSDWGKLLCSKELRDIMAPDSPSI